MENLVISVFNTESEAYQSFADLKAFRQTQTTKVAQIALVKNENGHIVEKERYDFEDSTTDATLEGGLLGAVIGLLGGPIGVLFGYGIGSLNGLVAGANSGCLRLTDFILIKLKIFLIITKHSQKAMTSIFTKKSRPILVQISCLLNILFKEWKNGCNGFVNAII